VVRDRHAGLLLSFYWGALLCRTRQRWIRPFHLVQPSMILPLTVISP
jgi:hypothetical protein